MFIVAEIILKYFYNSFGGWNNFIPVSNVVIFETKHWNNFEIISVLYSTCNQLRLHVKQNTEITLQIFQNNFISHVTTALVGFH